MSDNSRIDADELEAQDGQLLADREVMSILPVAPDAPLVVPDPEPYEASPEDPPAT